MPEPTAEHRRLTAHYSGQADWLRWGPYLSERAWGTVREDYSEHGTAWDHFPHDHARSRAYRWNEDGLAGICDRRQYLCLALALWNGNDAILKERLFGLAGPEGNHGEDAKEYYFYLDATPTHSYLKLLYKYPQAAFPYEELAAVNRARDRGDDEYELLDTGVFADERYWDVFVEYAKAAEGDILMQVTAVNRGPGSAQLHVLPTLWFRNTWSWGYPAGPMQDVAHRPQLRRGRRGRGFLTATAEHPAAGSCHLYAEGADELLFTDNDTNVARLFGLDNPEPYVKDAFHRYLIEGDEGAVNPAGTGTKVAAVYREQLRPRESRTLRLRLSERPLRDPFGDFTKLFARRHAEADDYHESVEPAALTPEERAVHRQALAGMVWSKQLYYYDVEQWLEGDPANPPPPQARRRGRNHDWLHLNNFEILSMPDKWEYPWYAAWDLAFHSLPLALVDPDFAKENLQLMTREWYMHASGQLPAYEWALGDVNPPVHAWAARRVYERDARSRGRHDVDFLEEVFHKLLLNFTWWVNRKDADGNNVFQGGFLGLDNISLFDRSANLPTGGHIDQSDGTAWMAFYTLGMLRMALELSRERPVYQGVATKFFEHFLSIARAMNLEHQRLWDSDDGFFYDVLHLPDGTVVPLKVRSLVGLIPLLAVEVIEGSDLEELAEFAGRMRWFLTHRPHLAGNVASPERPGAGSRILLSVLTEEQLVSVLRYLLDEGEFLSNYGIRSLSRFHEEHPYTLTCAGQDFTIRYEPAESRTGVFGGNSNWRGPVWFPVNYLIIEALREHYRYYGDELTVECPTGSGRQMTLDEVGTELARRLIRLFVPDERGRRPAHGARGPFQQDPHWRDQLLFYEYFHGDDGTGLGASHQTGWTGLVANLVAECAAAGG